MWLEEDPANAQALSEEEGILDLMYDVQGDTDAKEQEATIVLDNYEDGMKLMSGFIMKIHILHIFSHIEQDPADNNHHPRSCCCSADGCHLIDYVDEENEENDG